LGLQGSRPFFLLDGAKAINHVCQIILTEASGFKGQKFLETHHAFQISNSKPFSQRFGPYEVLGQKNVEIILKWQQIKETLRNSTVET